MSNRDFNQVAEPYSALVPTVVKQVKGGERGYDLFSRLMEDNTIMVHGPIAANMASIIVGQLLFLGAQLADQPQDQKIITMNIDSPGGSVHAGLSIYDTMNFVQSKYGVAISTVGLGMNMSMGSFLLCAGTPGYRYMLPNGDHMVHQPSGGAGGTASDIKIHAHHMGELHQRLKLLYTVHTNMDYDKVTELSDHGDSFLRAEECLALGIVDKVIYGDELNNNVSFAAGVKEHLEKIAAMHRRLNQTAESGRITGHVEKGPHNAIIQEMRAKKTGSGPAP